MRGVPRSSPPDEGGSATAVTDPVAFFDEPALTNAAFAGLTWVDGGKNEPPDASVAAGPNQVVEVVNRHAVNRRADFGRVDFEGGHDPEVLVGEAAVTKQRLAKIARADHDEVLVALDHPVGEGRLRALSAPLSVVSSDALALSISSMQNTPPFS